jgi:hypothetical protein
MHSTLSRILCLFISLVFVGFLMAMYNSFTVTYSTGNLRFVFLIFFLRLLKFSLLFLRDLFRDPCSSICLLMSCDEMYHSKCLHFADDIKSTELLNLPKTAICYRQILTPNKVGALYETQHK